MMEPSHMIIGILLIVVVTLAIRLGQANNTISNQKLEIMAFNAKRLAVQWNELLLNSKLKETPRLDPTTEKLLSLAAKSDNANEASVAAVQACKRIHKELGYK